MPAEFTPGKMKLERREFLQRIAAGSAVITMPAFLQGCGVTPAFKVTEAMPEDPFLDWFQIDQRRIARVMAALTANGADVAELYFQHRRRSVLRMEDGQISRASADLSQGVGIRVVQGGNTGFAFTEDLSLRGLLATAKKAAASVSGEAPVSVTDYRARPGGDLYRTEVAWNDVGIEQKLPLLQRVDSRARGADPSIDQVTISWSDTDERILIATLAGELIFDRRPLTRLSAQIGASRGGESHSGFANVSARDEISWYSDERIDSMVDEAVERTLALFAARRPPSGDMPVILAAGTSGVLLHEAIGHSLEADFIRAGKSDYADKLGEAVADSSVTIVDDGRLPNERGALNFDDEGNECGRTTLIENGVLRGWLHDRSSASEYGVIATGSGRRESYRHEPMPRMTCTFMQDGPYSAEELIGGMGRGIIAETYTTGSVELGAGDYTFYVKSGWLVEKGRLLMPIRDFRLHGNGPQTLRDITMVANDARLDKGGWSCGKKGQTVPVSQGMPSVLVSKLSVEAI